MSNRVRLQEAKLRSPRWRPALPSVRLPAGRPRRIAVGVLALTLVGLVTWVLWPEPQPRQREYLDATACLLTDDKGVAGEQAKPIWATMQDASVSSLVKVQYLQTNGPQTADNARTYVASLARSQCGVIIAVGAAQVDAVIQEAPTFPGVQFVTVGGGGGASANVSIIHGKSADDLRAAVKQQVDALAGHAS